MTALLALEPLARLSTHPLARTSEGHKAGPIGLGVILLLCISCYFLFKSMSKHMRVVRENFPAAEPTLVSAAATPVSIVKADSTAESSGAANSTRPVESTDTDESRPPPTEA